MARDATLHASWLAQREYEPLWREMQHYTDERDTNSPDLLWLTEHPGVYTLGLAARPEHVLAPGDIPVIRIDRGGEVTYHGPGQLMLYPLIDIRRAKLGVRALVTALEETVIEYCGRLDIDAHARKDAPGVYVGDRKLASVGLRIRRGASYHGMALNVGMDLEPFSRINPCGYSNLSMIDLARLGVTTTTESAGHELAPVLAECLGMRLAST